MNASRLFAVCATLLILSGCRTISAVPSFRDVAINPAPLHPGLVALITVRVEDKNNIVSRVEGRLRDTPEVVFRLRDDGLEGDERANDGIWSTTVDVPFEAPAGQYTIEFTAYRSDGQAVTVRNDAGSMVPLSVTYPFIVQYAQAAP
jgi:hypothetical protein